LEGLSRSSPARWFAWSLCSIILLEAKSQFHPKPSSWSITRWCRS